MAITTKSGKKIRDNSIEFVDIQQIATSVILGRSTAGTGNIETITIGSGLSLSGGVLSVSGGGGGSISGLTLATASNTINNAAYTQEWQWNSLASGNGLFLNSNSTAAASNTQTLLNVSLSGANATSTQTTFGAIISNTHTGTSSTNVALKISASGGNNNCGILINSTTSTPTALLQIHKDFNSVTQADTNGILLINDTGASAGLQSISPPIVWQGRGWATTPVTHHIVKYRAHALPVQGSGTPGVVWQLQSSQNGSAYTNNLTVDASSNVVTGAITATSWTGNGSMQSSPTLNISNFAVLSASGGSTNGVSQIAFSSATINLRTFFYGSTALALSVSNSAANVVIASAPMTEAGSGTHAVLANLAVKGFAITNAGGATTNAASLYIAGAPTGITPTGGLYSIMVGAGNSYFNGAFNCEGILSSSLTVLNANFYVVGSNIASTGINSAWYQFNGSSSVQFRTGYYGSTSTVLSGNTSYSSVNFGATPITVATSGTHGMLANVSINPIVVTSGSGTVSKTSTLFIEGATTGAADPLNNYTMFIKAGDSYNGGYQINKYHTRLVSDFTTTTTTLANVNGLSADVIASGVYKFRAVLHLSLIHI
jgi:hypothetical protein